MFKRASVDGRNENELIDISERLAPFVHADLGPPMQEQVVAANVTPTAEVRDVESSIAPLHLAT